MSGPSAADPRRFLRDGRLVSLPRRWRDRIAVTRYLATRAMPQLLEPVGERELTDRLAELAEDPVGLRRAMVDLGVVRRTRDGAEYWRTERTEHDPPTAVEQAVDGLLAEDDRARRGDHNDGRAEPDDHTDGDHTDDHTDDDGPDDAGENPA